YTVKVLDFGLVKLGDTEFPERKEPPSEKSWLEVADTAETEPPTLSQSPATEETDTLIQPADSVPPRIPTAGRPSVPGQSVAGDSGRTGREALMTEARSLIETAGAAELTRAGSIVGTPLYMSPEQWRGERLDVRSDIYSLGVIAYRMLCGETPFTGSLSELIQQHTTCEPPPVREKNSKVPRRVVRLIMSALTKDPAARPECAAALASALRASAEGSGTLLRQAVSLYSERFPTFLKISLLAHAPLIATIALMELSNKIVLWKHLTSIMIIALLLILGVVVANLLAYSI